MLLEKVVISKKRNIHVYVRIRMRARTRTRIYVHAHKSYICNTTCVFLHALKVPHIVYHSLHRKNTLLIVMKKVHEQVAKSFIKITSVGMGAAKSNETR